MFQKENRVSRHIIFQSKSDGKGALCIWKNYSSESIKKYKKNDILQVSTLYFSSTSQFVCVLQSIELN